MNTTTNSHTNSHTNSTNATTDGEGAARRGTLAAANSGIAAMRDIVGGIGVVHGNVYTAAATTPAQKLRQGTSCLRRRARERAVRLIEEAIDGGQETADAFYYLSLAILSGRSAEELTNQEWHQVRHALRRLAGLDQAAGGSGGGEGSREGSRGGEAEGGFGTAGRLISRLLAAALSDDPDAQATELLKELRELPPGRGTEVRGHLLHFLEAVRRNAADADEETEIRGRMAGGRQERVPKFFTPDPARPRVARDSYSFLLDEPQADLAAVAVAFLAGLGLAADGFGALGLVFAVPMLVGAFLLLMPGLRAGIEEERINRVERWMAEAEDRVVRVPDPRAASTWLRAWPAGLTGWLAGRSAAPPPGTGSGLSQRQRAVRRKFFVRAVRTLVEDHFQAQPGEAENAEEWQRISAGHQRALIAVLAHLHWYDTSPAELNWLVRYRAGDAADRWRRGELRPFGTTAKAWYRRYGKRLVVWGAFLSAWILAWNSPLSGLILGALWLGAAGVMLRTVRHLARQRLHEEDQRRRNADLTELVREKDRLRDRPTDEEMARWLDLDQRFLLRERLREHQVQRREVLFSFFLLEGARNCVRAKEPESPTRYSRYSMKLFVLTSGGVWISTWVVDFATGPAGGWRDMVFRFDSINSVMLETIGVRIGANRRELVAAVADGSPPVIADYDEPVIHEAMGLVLNTGERLDVLIENYDQLRVPGADNPEQMRALALENTGILSGFRILAALATEGPQWFQERRRLAVRELSEDS